MVNGKLSAILKGCLFRACGVAAGVLLAAVAAEIVLHLVPAVMPLPVRLRHGMTEGYILIDHVTMPDAELGYKTRPGLDGDVNHPPELPFHVRTIDLGYGDIGFRTEPPTGKPVIAVLGDSFAFATGVDDEEMWTRHLAELLDCDVLNFGAIGYGPQQYLRMLEHYALPFHPRIVIWLSFDNDLLDAEKFGEWLAQGGARSWKQQQAKRQWGPVRVYHQLNDLIKRNSLAWDMAGYGLRAIKRHTRTVRGEGVEFIFDRERWADRLATDSPARKQAWKWTRECLDLARGKALESGAELVVVLAPMREEVYWDVLRSEVGDLPEAYPKGLHGLMLDYCHEAGIPVLNLTPGLQALARDGRSLYPRVDGHFNASGNAAVASLIAAFLKETNLSSRLSSPPPIEEETP